MPHPNPSGACRCGAIRFEARANPHFSGYCHCEDCRRATGAPVVAFVGFHAREVTWRGEPAAYSRSAPPNDGPPVERLFCRTCGAPLGYRDARLPDRIYLYTAALDRPQDHPPRSHSYAGERLFWLRLADDLPQHPATSVPRPEDLS